MGKDRAEHKVPGVPFEAFASLDVPLGDLMRGERATLGKSLLDVERELKIKAAYIAAIENGDLSAFSSQGFIAGYVRSYSRYLGLDPEWTFERFCRESGFAGVHGLSGRQAGQAKRALAEAPGRIDPNDLIKVARVSFTPERENVFSNVEPGALGSALVLIALVAGIGYGAWAVLNDIQRLQFAPVEQAPDTLAALDPLGGAVEGNFGTGLPEEDMATAIPTADALDRLYRPQALDVPVMTPRDQPLATLDPDQVGTLAAPVNRLAGETAVTETPIPGSTVQVTERSGDEVLLFAVRPSWVRITSASGTVIYEGTLNAGDSYALPASEVPPTLRAGNSGSLYFAVNGVTMGPAGPGTSVARDVVLSADAISESFVMADATTDPDLAEVAALVLSAEPASGE
ncbi:helix-turn-helix domain-containing protein [Rhodophyticola sp. CCM32]|uniref:helix-turn-helix domain-containing protein n=1 Tax=Rhodophyticola sp. CCM32 TaxID=2916397 RepID=UPI00107F09B7|nr:helix-turn-helix domain-containing protein [Rhodophyticola sp. CCM32]QBY00584.1 helix-turn-helix domain-containing protein [Rhodophyticola sp. CCM32]